MPHVLHRLSASSEVSGAAALNQLAAQTPKAGTWVDLLDRPNDWSHDEALLLCEQSEHEWVAWIPDYGEATLQSRQFALKAN
jgi:hypothetical protein